MKSLLVLSLIGDCFWPLWNLLSSLIFSDNGFLEQYINQTSQ